MSDPREDVILWSPPDMRPGTPRCFRCGAPATVAFTPMIAHPGSPVCERCVVQIQTEHARERAAALPELETRLAALGGPYEGPTPCGYVQWLIQGDPSDFGQWCILEQFHDGFHQIEGSA